MFLRLAPRIGLFLTTAVGCEPAQAEPSRYLVYHLNDSDTLSPKRDLQNIDLMRLNRFKESASSLSEYFSGIPDFGVV